MTSLTAPRYRGDRPEPRLARKDRAKHQAPLDGVLLRLCHSRGVTDAAVRTSREGHDEGAGWRRWRISAILGGLLLAVAGVAWYFIATPAVWQAIFDDWYYADYVGSPPEDLTAFSHGVANHDTPLDWRLQLPLWLLVGTGAAVIAAVAALPQSREARRTRAARMRAAGVGIATLGGAISLIGFLAPDANGWTLLFASYAGKVWIPVFVIGVILLVGGVVLLMVAAATGPAASARAASQEEARVATAEVRKQAAIEAQAEQIKQFEAAYALAHDGKAPPPGYAPPAYFAARSPSDGLNSLAVLSFVLTLVAAGFLGLILGPIALGQIRRTGERGRGLAVASIVIAAVYVAVILVLVVVFAFILRR